MYALEVENLKFGYRKDLILDNISFKIKKGEFVSVVGPNGSGKSTLLKILSHIQAPWTGKVLMEGKNIGRLSKKKLALKMALLAQDPGLEYEFTVGEVVLMGRYAHMNRFQKEDKKDYDIMMEALAMTNTIDLKDRIITEISQGERQRVMIARALAQKTPIILLDEPTSDLDIKHQIEILKLLREMNEKDGITILLVIHDINLGIRYSDRIIMLDRGRLVAMGKSEEIITRENIKLIYDIEAVIEKNQHTSSLYITPLE